MWLLPSLDRPHLLEEFFKCYLKTESSTPGMVIVDKEDPRKEEYLDILYPPGWKLVLTDAVTMGDKVREVWDQVEDLDWVGILNDDHRPQTKHWDRQILAHINGANVVSTNDGITPDKPWVFGKKLCGAICFSGKVLRTLGWMFPPGLHHLYSDDVWGVMFSRVGNCVMLQQVCVWHDHAYIDQTKRDKTYEKINGGGDFSLTHPKGGMWDNDRQVFEKWMKEDCEKAILNLIAIQPKQGMMLGTPIHDNQVFTEYAVGLMDVGIALTQNNFHFEVARVVGSSLLPHARNNLVSMFLRSKCQRLLFVDADQGFNRNHVLTLLNSNRRIVAGIIPHKRYPLNLNFEPLDEDAHYFKDKANKSNEEFFKYVKDKADAKHEIQVKRVGTGFMMIDRSVFDVMKDSVEKYMPFDDQIGNEHDEFFKMGKIDNRYRGEDWYFCMLAEKLEIPIFINTTCLISHFGGHIYQIDGSKRLA